ncbi:hypothetical protein PMI04_006685 [Sphingobium sp. AP49]|uniref:hypothetical protein n=1 Tax=Sphingobium sp. AP49 TaxID=1144307 RepID=UPI00026EC8AB|nr:hypothetical protein [Sphingobium sp. AP49]WHO40275.1 hypothetical protein PMI04_006685 [Sphingobium sp. AP49]
MFLLDFLKSLDKLLYELMSWLVFYPITLWRALTHPLQLMRYADRELDDAPEEQYADTLSPPLFLLISLLLCHGLELGVIGQNALVKSRVGLDALISSDTNLILFRLIVYSLFPLLMAVRLLRCQKLSIDRNTLRAPFYGQCFLAAPLALFLGLGGTMMLAPHKPLWVGATGILLMLATLIWYGSLQIIWFAQQLGIGRFRAFLQASRAMIESLVAIILALLLV